MSGIVHITATFAVTAALDPDDFAAVAKLGFKSIVNNRPDGEQPGQLSSRREALLVSDAGLGYRHVPAAMLEATSLTVAAGMRDSLSSLEAPILAHCKSGLRSAMAWAAAQALSGRDVGALLAEIAAAGFDLEPVRDDLEAIARHTNSKAAPPRRTRRRIA